MTAQSFKRYIMPLFAFFIMLAGAKAGDRPYIWETFFNKGTIYNAHLLNNDTLIVPSQYAIGIVSTKDGTVLDTFPDVTKYIPSHTSTSVDLGIAYSDLSKDGKILVTVSKCDQVKCYVAVWDVAKKTPIKCFETPFSITDIKISGDSKYIIGTAYYSDEAVIVWNTEDYSIEKTIIDPSRGVELVISPDNKYVYISYLLENDYVGTEASIVKYDLNTWEPLDTFNLKDKWNQRMLRYAANHCTISPDGKYFGFTCDTTVYVYETEKLQLVNSYNFTIYPLDDNSTLGTICFSKNSDKIFMYQYVCSNFKVRKTAVEWNFNTDEEIMTNSNIILGLYGKSQYINSNQIIHACGDYIKLFDPNKSVSVKDDIQISDKIKLLYENPLSHNTELRVVSKDAINVKIDIYNESGKYIKCIYNGYIKGEETSIPLNISELNSGLYFIKVSDGNSSFDYQLIVKK